MSSIVKSKITAQSQTTVPKAVRTVLGLKTGEHLGYVIEGNQVRLVNASTSEHEDPVLGGFLEFLSQDMDRHPDRFKAFPKSLLRRARAAASQIVIDHDAPLDGVVSL